MTVDAQEVPGFKCSPRFPISQARVCWGSEKAVHDRFWGKKAFKRDDYGNLLERDKFYPKAFYDYPTDTTFAQDNEKGAKAAAVHERAHEEFLANPRGDGYTWE